MKTTALSSAVMLGTLTSAAMAGPAATTSAESLMELLDEQLDKVAGGSAEQFFVGNENAKPQSDRSVNHGRTHNTIIHS